jgi:hypothetical protein
MGNIKTQEEKYIHDITLYKKKEKERNIHGQTIFFMKWSKHTWKLPWLTSIKVNLCNLNATKAPIKDFGSQIKGYKFFISWVKPKPWWQTLLVYIFPSQLTQDLFHCQHRPTQRNYVFLFTESEYDYE